MKDKTLQRPANEDHEGWRGYWRARGMRWRTEPEIDAERKRFLGMRRAQRPDVKRGIFPFRDKNGSIQLRRADVEWLLATQKSGGITGPVYPSRPKHAQRVGVDLRGADLRGADLHGLPLARLCKRRTSPDRKLYEMVTVESEQADASVIHLDGADLSSATLVGANLERARLDGAIMFEAHLEGAFLKEARMQGVRLEDAHLEEANLEDAFLDNAHLSKARLVGSVLAGAKMREAVLMEAHLEGAALQDAQLQCAKLWEAHLEGTKLDRVHFEGADLKDCHFEGTYLTSSQVTRAQRWGSEYGKSKITDRELRPANLQGAYLDAATNLLQVTLGTQERGFAKLGDIHWGDANLATIDWGRVTVLGDEQEWQEEVSIYGIGDDSSLSSRYEVALRANRQLAVALRGQGLHEYADQFAYRARLVQRTALRQQRDWLRWMGSLILDLLAGYGYQPGRTILVYLQTIVWFTLFYGWATHGAFGNGVALSQIQPLTWYEALVLSISSFHGRGFFQPLQSLGDPVAILAAIEAVFGLIIEVSFIATFTQRFFAR